MEAFFETLLAAREIRDPLLPLWVMESLASVFLYVWLFALGATVGSFLNVVVYRLPRGKNLAYPGSSCPRCGHAIRLSDNIPILSWLALGGRCRDCGGVISSRYFVVELLVATTFLVVLVGERFLPAGSLGFATRRLLSPYDGVPFWCMYAMHLTLITTLIASVLIAGDGFEVPVWLYLPAFVIGLVLPLIWPEIRSLPAFAYGNLSGWQQGLIDGMAGLATAIAMATAVGIASLPLIGGRPAVSQVAMACCVGVVMGWQRTLWLWPLTFVVCVGFAAALRAIALSRSSGGDAERPLGRSHAERGNEGTETSESHAVTAGTLEALSPDVAHREVISEEVHIVNPPSEHPDSEPS